MWELQFWWRVSPKEEFSWECVDSFAEYADALDTFRRIPSQDLGLYRLRKVS